jgi:hypothetical protein
MATAARRPMMATTIIISTSVNPPLLEAFLFITILLHSVFAA